MAFSYNCKSYHKKLKVCKIEKYMLVSVSLVRAKFERIEREFKTEKIQPKLHAAKNLAQTVLGTILNIFLAKNPPTEQNLNCLNQNRTC